MLALRLHAPRDVRVEEIPRPMPGPDEVLVAVELTGLCGTDLSVYDGRYRTTGPLVMGHEMVGTVTEVGVNVKSIPSGVRVSAEGSWSCNACHACARGLLCTEPLAMGRTVDGCAAEFVAVPALAVHQLPRGPSSLSAQAFVTVATTAHALALVPATDVETVTVIGSGHAGLLMVQQLANTRPDVRIVMLGTRSERLDIAKNCGANECVNVADSVDREAYIKRAAAGGIGAVTIDASGTGDGLSLALASTSYGGRLVAYSVYSERLEVERLDLLYQRALTIMGSRGGSGHYEEAVRILSEGWVRPDVLAADPVPLADAPALLAALTAHRSNSKPRSVIACSENGMLSAGSE